VDKILDQIIQLGMLIRSASAASRLNKADASFGVREYESLDEGKLLESSRLPVQDLLELKTHLLAYLFRRPPRQEDNSLGRYTLNFESELRRLEPAHRHVLDYLIYSNLRRRNRFWYARTHGQKLAAAQHLLFPEQPNVLLSDSKLNTKQVQPTRDGRSGNMQEMGTPSITTKTDASTGTIDLRKLEELAQRYQGQHAMSRASVSLRKSGWPHPPKLLEDRTTFQCPCCHLTLSYREAEQWNWRYVYAEGAVCIYQVPTDTNLLRKHLSADMCAYTCLFPDCTLDNPMFATRDAWKAHLRLDHHSSQYWECLACANADDAIVFATSDMFVAHMETRHNDMVADIGTRRLSETCVRSDPVSIKFCPLCTPEHQSVDLDPDTLLDHIADHMHDFALESLPWMDFPEVRHLGGMSPDTTEKIAKWFDEITPVDQPMEEYHPGYPSEEVIQKAVSSTRSFFKKEATTDNPGRSMNSVHQGHSDYFAESRGNTANAEATNFSENDIDMDSRENSDDLSVEQACSAEDDQDAEDVVPQFEHSDSGSEPAWAINDAGNSDAPMESVDEDREMEDIQVPKVLTGIDCLTDTDNEVPVAPDDTGATSQPVPQSSKTTSSSICPPVSFQTG
jgi:hypothetical protein